MAAEAVTDDLYPIDRITEHPALDLVPNMRAAEFADLRNDIEERGIQVPVELTADGVLLDGRHRLRAARELRFHAVPFRLVETDDAEAYVLKAAVLRRHLTDDQRAMLAAKWKAQNKQQGARSDLTSPQRCGEVDAVRESAETFQVPRRKVDEATTVLRAAPEVAERVATGEVKLKDAVREVKREQRQEENAARVATLPDVGERYRLLCCDLLETDIEPESIDCIITDPPYPEEFLPTYRSLAALAETVLKPGGSLLAMAGHCHLPSVIHHLENGVYPFTEDAAALHYQWILAYLMPASEAANWSRKVMTEWKPVLWYVKGSYSGEMVRDVAHSRQADKEHHHWGQSESGMADLIEKFTKPGDTILDPFLGGGTTGLVALKLNRLFVGVDVDPTCIETTKARIADIVRGE
jgi:site-specific DNA-methyltransferase (adenine-specific)